MNKRDLVLSLLDKNKKPGYIPAAFFIHFLAILIIADSDSDLMPDACSEGWRTP